MTTTATARHTSFLAADGCELGEYRWDVPDAQAHVVLVHGAGEHLGRYEHVAAALNAAGFSASGFDHRAHGRTPMPWWRLQGQDALLDDLARYVEAQVADSPVPVFVVAHSMGGGLALVLASEDRLPVRGLVVSGPTAKLDDDLAPLARKLAGLFSAVLPMLPMVGGLDTKVSRDPEVQRAFAADPLVPSKVPARLAHTVLTLTDRCQKGLDGVALPLLVMHGTSDLLTAPVGSQQLYDRSPSQDKTLRLFDGWYHELYNEPGREEAIAEMVSWIKSHI